MLLPRFFQNRCLLGIAGTIIATPWIPVPSKAQDFASVSNDAVHTQSGQRGVAKQLVTYHGSNVSVDEVLSTLSRQTGLGLIVDRTTVKLDARISVTMQRMPLAEALDTIASRSDLQMRISPDRGSILVLGSRKTAEDGILTGRVIHATTRQPVSGATISVEGSSTQATTKADGHFQMSLKAGEYVLRIRAVGMTLQTKAITISEGKAATIEIVLEPNANVLNEVVVTGSVIATERKAIPTPITVVTAEDIEKRGITRVEQLFRGEIPGLLVAETGTQAFADTVGALGTVQLYSRGSSDLTGKPNPIKTYIDGVELFDPSYLGTLDPQSIERIEIVTGPQAATIYGSGAMGGVMQIFTKKGMGKEAPEVTINLRYGTLENNVMPSLTPTHKHSLNVAGGGGPAFSYAATTSYDYTGQWQPSLFVRRIGGSLGATHVRGPFRATASFGVMYGKNGTVPGGANDYAVTPFVRGRLESGYYYFSQVSNNSYGYSSFFTQRVSLMNSNTASFSADHTMSSLFQQHVTIGMNRNDFVIVPESPKYRTPVDTLFENNGSKGARTTAGYNFTVSPPRWHRLSATLTMGANGSSGEQVSYGGCTTRKDDSMLRYCNGLNAYTPVTTFRVNTSNDGLSWGMFGNSRVGVMDQVYLTMGVRGERNPNYGGRHSVDWTPTYGVTYTFDAGDLTVKTLASYGKATRPPLPYMRSYTLSINPAYTPSEWLSQFEAPFLRPERETGPQGGVELYYGSFGSITVNYYKQTVDDLIQRLKVDSLFAVYTGGASPSETYLGNYQYVNIGVVEKKGWEATISLNVASFSFKGTYSWNDSRILRVDPSLQYVGGKLFPNGISTHAGNVTLSYARGGLSLMLVSNIMGSALRSITDGMRTAEMIDQRDSYQIRENMYIARRKSVTGEIIYPGYVKSDLNFSQRLASWVSLTAHISNLTDSYASEVSAYYPTLGRQTTFGLSLRFPRR